MEFVKKHLITIVCVVSIILLALPLATVVSSSESEHISAVASTSKDVSGFGALQVNFLAYLLIVGPALLIAMNYIQPMEKFKGLLAIVVPVLCLIALVITVIQCKTIVSASVGGSLVKINVSLKVGIGAILLGIAYIGTAVAGAVTYHNFSFDKAGLERLKESSAQMLSSAKEAGANLAGTVKDKATQLASHTESEAASAPTADAPNATGSPAPGSKPAFVKSAPAKKNDLNRIEEILSLIERLSQMKDAGILTDEEFSNKKQQLLEEL